MIKRIILFVVLAAALLGGNYLVSTQISSYYETVILHAGIFLILAVSLNLVNGFTGQFSIGHAGFYAIGAYVGAALTTYGQHSLFGRLFAADGSTTWYAGGLVLVIAMIVGGLAAAAAGLIVGLPSLKLRGDYLAIVTLGLNQIIIVVLNNQDIVGGSRGFGGPYIHDTLVAIPQLASFFWIFLVGALLIIFSINLRYSVHGLAFISIREDEVAAEAMGVPTTKYKVTAFVIGAFFAGVAGVLFAHTDRYLSPSYFDFVQSINIVVMVVLGGMGSVSGTAIGAVLLSVLPELLRGNREFDLDKYRLVIYSLLLIVLMLVRPQGIFGQEELSVAWLKNQAAGARTLPARCAAWFRSLPQRLSGRRGDRPRQSI
jgi:branched-chain amino acid transport system permease protein